MRKTLTATIVALISTPALANSGHIIQVHHGADCVEFALVEDANTKCGPNVYIGGLNPECTALIPWYGISAGEGVGQTPLTASQLPFFLDATSAIDTAYRLYQPELQLEYAQAGIQGVIVIDNPSEVASLDTTSAIGFTVNGTLTCKDISAYSKQCREPQHSPNILPDALTRTLVKTNLESLVEQVTRFLKEQALKPLYTMVGSAGIVIAWIELFWRHCL